MDRDIWLLIVGALIGFVGSTLSTFVSYVLENKRTKRQWQRDDFLRAKSRKRDEIKLAQDFNMQSNSSFSCSQAESTPAPAPVTQTVGQTERKGARP